jgi:hypothetical protein
MREKMADDAALREMGRRSVERIMRLKRNYLKQAPLKDLT